MLLLASLEVQAQTATPKTASPKSNPIGLVLQQAEDLGGGGLADVPVIWWPIECPGHPSHQGVLAFSDDKGQVPRPIPAHCAARVRVEALGHLPLQDTLPALTVLTNPPIRTLAGSGVALAPLVITGQSQPTSTQRAVHAVRVIDRNWIDAQGAVNLRDVLTQALNVRITQDLMLGSVLTLQGMGGQNVKIMIDHVPVIGRQDGNIDLSQLNLNDIERIEIIEGPMAVNYGADALGGVINLITRRPATASASDTGKVQRVQAGLNLYGETAGHLNADGHIRAHIGRHHFTAQGGRNFFGGWSPERVSAARGHQWKPRIQYFGSAQYQWQPTQRTLLSYRIAGLSEEIVNLGKPVSRPSQVFALDEYFRTRRLDQTLQFSHSFGQWHAQAVAAYNHYSRAREIYRKDLVSLGQEPAAARANWDTTAFDLVMSRGSLAWQPDELPFSLQAGYEINHETGRGRRLGVDNPQITDLATFLIGEYKPSPRFSLQPGVRLAYNSAYRAPWVPALHTRWQLTSRLTLRASYAQGFRAPSLRELHLFFVDINHNIQGNPELLPENSHNVQGELRYLRPLGNGTLGWLLSGYWNAIENRISLALVDFSTQLYQYVNIGAFRATGGRTELSWQQRRLTLKAGMVYNGVANRLGSPDAPFVYRFTPEYQLSAQYQPWERGPSFAVLGKHNGRLVQVLQGPDGQLRESFMEGFTLLDASVTQSWFKNRVRLTVGGQNLLNVQAVQANTQSGAHSGGGGMIPVGIGRSGFARLSLEW
jgi:outer membrane receptor for ferrienterochelin and colicins